MRIIVCIKQVPGVSTVEIDEQTGTLKRDNAPAKINPYDLYAVESAVKLKEHAGGTVTALSMGPPQAAKALEEAIYMGADDALLLSDRAFAGADVKATAYALSQAVLSLGDFDVIICGKQTTDGDTAQVGPELAEFLDIPHVAWVTSVEYAGERLQLVSDMDERILSLSLKLPCLITVEKDIYTPRLPSYKRMRARTGNEVRVIGLKALADTDAERYGQDGSPTRVERIFAPEPSGELVYLHGIGAKQAEKLVAILKEKRVI